MFRSFGKLFFILAAAAVFAMPAARADDQVKIGLNYHFYAPAVIAKY